MEEDEKVEDNSKGIIQEGNSLKIKQTDGQFEADLYKMLAGNPLKEQSSMKKEEIEEKKEEMTDKVLTSPEDRSGLGIQDISEKETESGAKTGERYLQIRDIADEYTYEYISELGDEFKSAMEFILKQEVVGLDTEFVTEGDTARATYVQISTNKRGFIFNLQKSRYFPEFREAFKQLCESTAIRKVGFSMQNDTQALNRAFNNSFELFQNFYSIDHKLYLNKGTSGLGLSDLCKRYFGRRLDKGAQKSIAYLADLEEERDREYAILDALVPLRVYEGMQKVLDTELDETDMLVLADEFESGMHEFILDIGCRDVEKLMSRQDEFSASMPRDLTYQGKQVVTRTRCALRQEKSHRRYH